MRHCIARHYSIASLAGLALAVSVGCGGHTRSGTGRRLAPGALELVVGDGGIEWTHGSAGKFRPGGGGQGSTAAEVRRAGPLALRRPWSTTQSAGR